MRVIYLRLLFILLVTIVPSVLSAHAGSEHLSHVKPNIVLIYADDVDCETVFGSFPQQPIDSIRFKNLRSMAEAGLRLTNFHVTTPVCGPSRACLYTGQYSHRNGFRVNDPNNRRASGFSGGYKTFDPNNEFATWMKRAGYTTAHVGKYLHADFKPDYDNGIYWKHIVPPGWDDFRLSLGCEYRNFPTYSNLTDEIVNSVGQYRTDWEVKNAVEIIEGHAKAASERPLLLCWSPIGAHIAANHKSMGAERHSSLYTETRIPELHQRLRANSIRPVDEMRSLIVPGAGRLKYMEDVYRQRLRAIQSIDDGIGILRDALSRNAMLKNTVFIFTSDHGFRFAQHRHFGKRLPYDRITRVPFIVTGPDIPPNSKCESLLANIDIAPTILKLAGAELPAVCDGTPFAKLLYEPDTDISGREAILIENWGDAVSHRQSVSATYSALRMKNKIYTQWATGGREFYDLESDPEQMANLYEELDTKEKQGLDVLMRSMRTCNNPPVIGSVRQHGVHAVSFSGFVEADRGIDRLELDVCCCETGKFFDGKNWTANPHRFSAVLDQPGGLISRWSVQLCNSQCRPASADMIREINLSVVATDMQGRQTIRSDNSKFSVIVDLSP